MAYRQLTQVIPEIRCYVGQFSTEVIVNPSTVWNLAIKLEGNEASNNVTFHMSD
jgi:hypothetical protein